MYKIKTVERNIEKRMLLSIKRKRWLNSSHDRLNISNPDNLSINQKQAIKDYFSEYVAINDFSDHEFYTACTGVFHANYIPDWFFYTVVDPFFNDWEKARIVDNKCFYEMMFPNCKQPYCIAFRINGIWFSHARSVISYQDVLTLIEAEKEAVFIKVACESNGGHGVYRVTGEDPQIYINKICGDVVIQRALKQSEILNRLNHTSVNTVRVLSLLSEGGVKIYSKILRCGISGAFVDNASSGGVTIGITETGRLKEVAYDKYGKKYDVHPTTNLPFNTVVIPNIHMIDELVCRLHPLIPYFRMVSWDIAIDDNNQPVLIEANMMEGELDFHQLNNGPLFGADTIDILRECLKG